MAARLGPNIYLMDRYKKHATFQETLAAIRDMRDVPSHLQLEPRDSQAKGFAEPVVQRWSHSIGSGLERHCARRHRILDSILPFEGSWPDPDART